MAVRPLAVHLLPQAHRTTIGHCLRLSPSFACLLLAATSLSTPAIAALQAARPIFAAANSHRHRPRFDRIAAANCSQSPANMNHQEFSHDREGGPPANKKTRADTSSTESVATKGTLYITVAPQCAGKTTMLKTILAKPFDKVKDCASESLPEEKETAAGVDITIDDQALVYIPVPTSYFLTNSTSNTAPKVDAIYPSPNDVIYGKTVQERILDQSNEELVLVLQRLGGTIGAKEFASRLRESKCGDAGGTTAAPDDLIDAVENFIDLQAKEGGNDQVAIALPETVDLFVVESIFRPRPLEMMQKMSGGDHSSRNASASSETPSALDRALDLLKAHATSPRTHSPTAPLSWGNTNTRPRDFESVLEAAATSGRPVEFIVFGGMEACEAIRERVSKGEIPETGNVGEGGAPAGTVGETADEHDKSIQESSLLWLPKVDRRTLLARNLRRFLQEGRYIPSKAIIDATVRVESLLASAAAEASKERIAGGDQEGKNMISMTTAKFWLDCELAKKCRYRLNVDRTVTRMQGSTINKINGDGQGNRNRQHERNRYPPIRGYEQNQHRSRNYSGRGSRGYSGRGGRSSSRSGRNFWGQNGRPYDNPRRVYGQARGQQSHTGGYHPRTENGGEGNEGYYPRTENGGQGNYFSSPGLSHTGGYYPRTENGGRGNEGYYPGTENGGRGNHFSSPGLSCTGGYYPRTENGGRGNEGYYPGPENGGQGNYFSSPGLHGPQYSNTREHYGRGWTGDHHSAGYDTYMRGRGRGRGDAWRRER